MDTAVAIVDVGVCGVDALRALKGIDVGRIGVVVTDVAVREHTLQCSDIPSGKRIERHSILQR